MNFSVPRKKKLPPCVRRHGSGYRAVVAVDGVRHRSLVLPTVEKVEKWIRDFRAGSEAQRHRPIDLTLAAGLHLIETDLAQTGGRQATIDFYRNHARILFAGLGGELRAVHTIETADLRRYIDTRRRAGVAPQTIVGKELFVLRRLRKLALAAGYLLPVDPFDGLRMPKGRAGRFEVLTRERIGEIVAKMRAAGRKGPWHADIVELMFATGLRRAEVARLRVSDIDLAARRIAVDGKTGHRYQPFGDALEPVLLRLIAAAQPGGRIVRSVRTVEKLFEHWRKKADEPRFAPHVMRHSYATAMAGEVGPYELMALMGHASLTQTSRYYHGRGDAVRGALNTLRLGPPSQEPSAD